MILVGKSLVTGAVTFGCAVNTASDKVTGEVEAIWNSRGDVGDVTHDARTIAKITACVTEFHSRQAVMTLFNSRARLRNLLPFRLPPRCAMWMVEVSLPDLFPRNKRKIGELVLDASREMGEKMAFAPAAAHPSATAEPIPPVAPVTKTEWPRKSKDMPGVNLLIKILIADSRAWREPRNLVTFWYSGSSSESEFWALNLDRRRLVDITPHPDGLLMLQMSRNLTDAISGFLSEKRFLVIDRDALYSTGFLRLLEQSETRLVRTPQSAPNCFALLKRFIWPFKREAPVRVIFLVKPHCGAWSTNTSIITTAKGITKVSTVRF